MLSSFTADAGLLKRGFALLDQEEELTVGFLGITDPLIGPLHARHHVPFVVHINHVEHRAHLPRASPSSAAVALPPELYDRMTQRARVCAISLSMASTATSRPLPLRRKSSKTDAAILSEVSARRLALPKRSGQSKRHTLVQKW